MSAVRFEERSDGRTDVMLGVVAVGVIMPLDHPEVWWLALPSVPTHPRPAIDSDTARKAAIRAVNNNWLHAAGLLERKDEPSLEGRS